MASASRRRLTQTISIVEAVGYKRIKTEHAGAKNGGGAWTTRTEAKESAKRSRRQIDKQDVTDALLDERPTPSLVNRTDHDPRPGAFDAYLDASQSSLIEIHTGNPHARLVVLGAPAKPKGANE